MIRSLDFTVDPDKTYRFRMRIVVFNPNRNREDVSPGIDTKSPELFGPWSEPTNEVTMPPDVATYAMKKVQAPRANQRADQVPGDQMEPRRRSDSRQELRCRSWRNHRPIRLGPLPGDRRVEAKAQRRRFQQPHGRARHRGGFVAAPPRPRHPRPARSARRCRSWFAPTEASSSATRPMIFTTTSVGPSRRITSANWTSRARNAKVRWEATWGHR